MSNITYRRPEEHEAPEIFRLGCECFEINRYPYSAWSLEKVRRLIAEPNIAWVAETNGHIVGFIGAHAHYPGFPDDHGYAEWCFILPGHRRRGISSELNNRVQRQYQKLGKRYIVINTTPDNKSVQKFVQKEGYQVYAEDIFYRKEIPKTVCGE